MARLRGVATNVRHTAQRFFSLWHRPHWQAIALPFDAGHLPLMLK
jgi:hypothetical protein